MASSKPSKKTSYHHGNLRQSLIEVAVEFISERGKPEFTLRELAQRLGVTHAATYHHFRDKDDLLAAVAEQGYQNLGEHMREVMKAHQDDHPAEMIQHMGEEYVRFAMDNQGHFRIMFGYKFADIDEYPAMRESGQQTLGLVEELIREGQEAGIYKDSADAAELAAVSWSMVHGMSLLLISGHFADIYDEDDLEGFVLGMSRHLFSGTASKEALEQLRELGG